MPENETLRHDRLDPLSVQLVSSRRERRERHERVRLDRTRLSSGRSPAPGTFEASAPAIGHPAPGGAPVKTSSTTSTGAGRREFNVSRQSGSDVGELGRSSRHLPAHRRWIAKAGYSKDDVSHICTSIRQRRQVAGRHLGMGPVQSRASMFCKWWKTASCQRPFCESDIRSGKSRSRQPKWVHIIVTGDPGRNQVRGTCQRRPRPMTSKKIEVPADWMHCWKHLICRS